MKTFSALTKIRFGRKLRVLHSEKESRSTCDGSRPEESQRSSPSLLDSISMKFITKVLASYEEVWGNKETILSFLASCKRNHEKESEEQRRTGEKSFFTTSWPSTVVSSLARDLRGLNTQDHGSHAEIGRVRDQHPCTVHSKASLFFSLTLSPCPSH